MQWQPAPEWVQSLADEHARSAGLTWPVVVKVVRSPDTEFGIQGAADRYEVLVGERWITTPEGSPEAWTRRRVSAVLAHELGHVMLGHCEQEVSARRVKLAKVATRVGWFVYGGLVAGYVVASVSPLLSGALPAAGAFLLLPAAGVVLLATSWAKCIVQKPAVGRAEELAADAFAVRLVRDPAATAAALCFPHRGRVKRQAGSVVAKFLGGGHPTLNARLDNLTRVVRQIQQEGASPSSANEDRAVNGSGSLPSRKATAASRPAATKPRVSAVGAGSRVAGHGRVNGLDNRVPRQQHDVAGHRRRR